MASESRIAYYHTMMTELEHSMWSHLILSGKSIPPEAIGILLGRAEPVFKPAEPIDEKDLYPKR